MLWIILMLIAFSSCRLHVTGKQVAEGHLTVVCDVAIFSTFTANKHTTNKTKYVLQWT